MSLVSMITQGQSKRTTLKSQDGKTELLVLDATLKIAPKYSAKLTQFPVEDGPDISDHIRLDPITIEVEAMMSETPITLQSQLAGLGTGAAGAVGSLLGGFGTSIASAAGGALGSSLLRKRDEDGKTIENPATAARKIIENIFLNKVFFSLYDKYRSYENLVITSLSFPREVTTGGKLSITFTAQEVRIVNTETVQIEKVHKPVAHAAAKPKNLGTQTPTRGSSALFKGGNVFGLNLRETGFLPKTVGD